MEDTMQVPGTTNERVGITQNSPEILTNPIYTPAFLREQIGKLIDKQDENFKVLLSAPQQNNQNEMIMQLLPQILANPDSLKTIIELSKK